MRAHLQRSTFVAAGGDADGEGALGTPRVGYDVGIGAALYERIE